MNPVRSQRLSSIIAPMDSTSSHKDALRASSALSLPHASGSTSNGVNSRVLIFFHLAKTGGVTLKKILKRQVPRGFRFGKLNVSSFESKATIEDFKSWPQEKRDKIAVLAGHMPFGLHEYLSRPCDYITILRDPVEVVTSVYYYITSSGPGYYWHREIPRLDSMSLGDFAKSGLSIAHNHQTRLLSGGFRTFFENAEPLAADALKRAKQNLRDHFKIVGVTERFGETLLVMKKAFGWRNVLYARENTTRAKKKAGAIPPEIRNIILENNKLDFELWKFAAVLLDESIANYGPSFQGDLRRFKKTNVMYQAVFPFYFFGRALTSRVWRSGRGLIDFISRPK